MASSNGAIAQPSHPDLVTSLPIDGLSTSTAGPLAMTDGRSRPNRPFLASRRSSAGHASLSLPKPVVAACGPAASSAMTAAHDDALARLVGGAAMPMPGRVGGQPMLTGSRRPHTHQRNHEAPIRPRGVRPPPPDWHRASMLKANRSSAMTNDPSAKADGGSSSAPHRNHEAPLRPRGSPPPDWHRGSSAKANGSSAMTDDSGGEPVSPALNDPRNLVDSHRPFSRSHEAPIRPHRFPPPEWGRPDASSKAHGSSTMTDDSLEKADGGSSSAPHGSHEAPIRPQGSPPPDWHGGSSSKADGSSAMADGSLKKADGTSNTPYRHHQEPLRDRSPPPAWRHHVVRVWIPESVGA